MCVLSTWPRGYKTFFTFKSTEHEISTAHRNKIPTKKKFLALNLTNVVFIMLINVKMPLIVKLRSCSAELSMKQVL